jgi:hypothetical protein
LSALDQDPEIQAIQAIVDRLGPLTAAARQRVLAWAQGRFGVDDHEAELADLTPAHMALLARQPPFPSLPRQVQPGNGEQS